MDDKRVSMACHLSSSERTQSSRQRHDHQDRTPGRCLPGPHSTRTTQARFRIGRLCCQRLRSRSRFRTFGSPARPADPGRPSVMPSKVYSAAVVGVEAFEVEIEVHAGWGNSDKIAVVGLPDTAVKESKDRVPSAICKLGVVRGSATTHNVLHRAGYHVPRAEDAPVPNSEDINQRCTRPSRCQGD